MDTGISPEHVIPYLPPQGRLAVLGDTGHFFHVEGPMEVAAILAELLM